MSSGRVADDGVRRAEVLGRAALVLASELSLPVVLQNIADLAAEVADAKYAALGVLAPDGTLIEEFVTHGVSDEERAAIGAPPKGHGILGALIRDANPLRLVKLQDDPRSVGFPPNHPPMTTFLGVPVAIHEQVFGNLYLTEKHGGGPFTDEDEGAVIRLAAHAAVAVENARLYHQAQLAQRRLAAVNQVADAILEGRSADEALRLIALHARELVGARTSAIATPGAGSDALVVRVADGDGAAHLQGAPFVVDRSGSGDVVLVPLQVGERGFGTLAVMNKEHGKQFTEQELAVLRMFAAQAAVALEHARIQSELRRLALAEDRERIAKELHDDVIQSLFAEGMAIQASLQMLHDPEAMEARLTSAVENIDRVIRDLRNYIFGLQPGASADRQLDRSLRDLAAHFQAGSEAEIEVMTDAEAVSRLAGHARDIVQAAREAISNGIRHAGAHHIMVALYRADDQAILEVSDDGSGFDAVASRGTGHGLLNLEARAEALGGELEIESEPGRGTWIRIRIPI